MRLNLACGVSKKEGYVNVDISPECTPDVVADLLLFPYQWDSDSIDEIACHHFIEHIPHRIPGVRKDGLIAFMEECYRILRPGGEMRVSYPWHQTDVAYGDPTHCRFITPITLEYFNAVWLKNNHLAHYGIETDFSTEPVTVWQVPRKDGDMANITKEWNIVRAVEAKMMAHKPRRTP